MKINIVLRPGEFTTFNSSYLNSLWSRYFNITWYDPSTIYHTANTLFVVWWQRADNEYSKNLRDRGYKVVVDNLWEVSTGRTDYYWLENPNWCWYNESLWWRSLGYHQYTPQKQYSKLAFMPIRRQTSTRDQIVKKLTPMLDNFIWSYQNQKLPNDIESFDIGYQRFFNPEWYDDTYFSTVVETHQQGTCYWPTEKTFKACAYYHPFLLIGQHHALKKLKQMGFNTFDNIFDESYDDINDFDLRVDAVIKNINNFKQVPYDAETQRRLQHNHDHFFDQALVESGIVTEIINPLLEYAQA
jgi:hypothetical protein